MNWNRKPELVLIVCANNIYHWLKSPNNLKWNCCFLLYVGLSMSFKHSDPLQRMSYQLKQGMHYLSWFFDSWHILLLSEIEFIIQFMFWCLLKSQFYGNHFERCTLLKVSKYSWFRFKDKNHQIFGVLQCIFLFHTSFYYFTIAIWTPLIVWLWCFHCLFFSKSKLN